MFLSIQKLYWQIRTLISQHRPQFLILFLVISTIGTMFLVSRLQSPQSLSIYADNSLATLSFEPSTLALEDALVVKVWATTTTPAAFAHAVISFDPQQLQLAKDPDLSESPLTKLVLRTTKEHANQSGLITIVSGLDPTIKEPSLTDTFSLATLTFTYQKNSDKPVSLNFEKSSNMVDLTAQNYTITTTQGLYFPKNSEVSPAPEASIEPTNSIIPASSTDPIIPPDPEENSESPETEISIGNTLSIKIVKPQNGSTVSQFAPIYVRATPNLAPGSQGIAHVKFYLNDHLRWRDTKPKYKYAFFGCRNCQTPQTYTIKAVATDLEGRTAEDTVTITTNAQFRRNWFCNRHPNNWLCNR